MTHNLSPSLHTNQPTDPSPTYSYLNTEHEADKAQDPQEIDPSICHSFIHSLSEGDSSVGPPFHPEDERIDFFFTQISTQLRHDLLEFLPGDLAKQTRGCPSSQHDRREVAVSDASRFPREAEATGGTTTNEAGKASRRA